MLFLLLLSLARRGVTVAPAKAFMSMRKPIYNGPSPGGVQISASPSSIYPHCDWTQATEGLFYSKEEKERRKKRLKFGEEVRGAQGRKSPINYRSFLGAKLTILHGRSWKGGGGDC